MNKPPDCGERWGICAEACTCRQREDNHLAQARQSVGLKELSCTCASWTCPGALALHLSHSLEEGKEGWEESDTKQVKHTILSVWNWQYGIRRRYHLTFVFITGCKLWILLSFLFPQSFHYTSLRTKTKKRSKGKHTMYPWMFYSNTLFRIMNHETWRYTAHCANGW